MIMGANELMDIKFDNVTFKYPGQEKPALTNFDLEFEKGEIALITEPNGAGKTTVCRCMSLDSQAVKVCLITSSGLKDPDATSKILKRLPSTEPDWVKFKSLMREVYQFEIAI